MNQMTDWAQKLRQAVDRIVSRYEHIGRNTGAPFLAIVYPPDCEIEVLREWKTLTDSLSSDYDFREVDVLELTSGEVDKLGVQNIVSWLKDPMPGSNAETELGQIWVAAVANAVKEISLAPLNGRRLVVVLQGLAALYPVTGPRAVMQCLWDSQQSVLNGPVVVLIPGSLQEPRVYRFLNLVEEFMYRGDIM